MMFRSLLIPAMGVCWVGLCGCNTGNPLEVPGLAATETVAVSDTESAEADLGSGVAALANTTWVVRKTEDDSLLFRLRYGEEGELVELFDNAVLAQPWLGDTIVFDAKLHDTDFAGGRYISGSYGAQVENQVGFLGIFHGLYLGVQMGTARVSFFTTYEAGQDRVEGTFVRRVETFATPPFAAPPDADIAVYSELES